MLEPQHKQTLTALTLSIDIFLLYVLYRVPFNIKDKIWIYTVLVSHVIFLHALYTDNRTTLDLIHPLIFILPFLSLFATNIWIKTISAILLIIIQLLWIKENKCILNEKTTEFGYGDELAFATLITTSLLCLNIGYKANKKL